MRQKCTDCRRCTGTEKPRSRWWDILDDIHEPIDFLIVPFRLLWVVAVPLGAVVHLDFVWLVADTLNAMMAIPNLIGLLLLTGIVARETREYSEGSTDGS